MRAAPVERTPPRLDPFNGRPEHPLECFAQPRLFPVRAAISAVDTGDVDEDGNLDVLISYSVLDDGPDFDEYIEIHRGDGAGSLALDQTVATGAHMSYVLSAADIDGDGHIDVAVNSARDKRVLLFAGRGDGSLEARVAVATGRMPMALELADVDGDRRLDLLVAFHRHLQLFLGQGLFRFRPLPAQRVAQAPDRPLVADLDGDRRAEIAVVANDGSQLLAFSLDARERLAVRSRQVSCSGPAGVRGADLDRDGDLDLVYSCDDELEVRLNDGRGKLTASTISVPNLERHVVGDFTGDGIPDIVAMGRESPLAGSDLTLFEGDGKGGFRARAHGHALGEVSNPVAADLDRDGRLDLVTSLWTGTEPAHLAVWLAGPC